MSSADTLDRLPRRVLTLWIALYAVTSVVMCTPFLPLNRVGDTPASGDSRLIAWTLAWHARWPLVGARPLDAPFFAPEPNGLVHSEPMLALGLAVAPLTLGAGPYVAYDALRLLIPVANALAMAMLVWHYLRDGWAAVVAGFALGFAYSQIASVYIGMVHLALLAGLMLTARALDRWWPTGRWRDLVPAVAWACVQALVAWYAAVIAVLTIVVQLVWLAAAERLPGRELSLRGLWLGGAALTAGVLLWPLAAPFLDTPRPSLSELHTYSLEAQWFVQPPADSWLGAWLTGAASRDVPWDYRRSYFIGLPAGLAAIAGIVVVWRGPAAAARLAWGLPLALLGFLLSLGPSSPGAGWRLFDVLTVVPGAAAFRVPGRMAVLVAVGVAMLIGAAVHAVPRPVKPAIAALLSCLLLADGLMAQLAPTPAASLVEPPIVRLLDGERPDVLLIVPMLRSTERWPAEADYLHFARRTWTPIVNGYGRNTSAVYDVLSDLVARSPEQPLVDALRYYGVTHVLVLAGYADDGGARFTQAADANPEFERVAEADGDTLYRVLPARTVGGQAGPSSTAFMKSSIVASV